MLRTAALLIPFLALALAVVLPLAVVRGPFIDEIAITPARLLADAVAGEDPAAEAAPSPLDGLAREAAELRIPWTGPVLLALALLALAAHHVLAVPAAVLLARGRPAVRLRAVWLSTGLAFVLLFLVGAQVVQRDLNRVEGRGVLQRLMAAVAAGASRFYELRLGAGGILVGAGVAVGLCHLLATRPRPARPGPATSTACSPG